MAEDQAEQWEKTEEATPYKLREARNKGMVAKSADVNTVLLLGAAALYLLASGPAFIKKILDLCVSILSHAGRFELSVDTVLASGNQWLQHGLSTLAPLIVLLSLVGILASATQTGLAISSHPIKPDFTRLNPVTGIQRLLSGKMLFELGKTLLKFALATFVLASTLRAMLPALSGMRDLQVSAQVSRFLALAFDLLIRIVAVLALLALADLLFVRKEFGKKMRMTKRELKDEIKRREGDPQIRSKRRSLEQELRKRAKSLSAVSNADLIITNPTRLAIVIQYDREKMAAPVVTGKGAGEMARAIREKAARLGVPIIQAPPLARRLYRETRIDKAIPQSSYVAVAHVLRKAYSMRKNRSGVVTG